MIRALVTVLCLATSAVAFSQESFTVAVIKDSEESRLEWQRTALLREFQALTSREFDVEIKRFVADWSRESIEEAAEAAYSDPDVDLVLVTGFIANQVLARRNDYPKPTFLPIVIDTGLFYTPPVDGRSGIPNLNYLATYADFSTDLEELGRMVRYTNVTLLIDQELSQSIPVLRERAFAAAGERGINLAEVPHDGVDHRLLDRLPPDTEALFLGGLARMPEAAFDELIAEINRLGYPSYSFAGVTDVERGLLMTNSEPRDIDRQARLNALNMQAVMLGGRAEDQPIDSQIKDRLTINMATARQIGISPSFEVLADATLLNPDVEITGDELGLVDIAMLAVAENQELLAEAYGVNAGFEEIARARANLLPFLSANVTNTTRKDSPSVQSGFFPERSNDAALSLNQVIYSDSASANLTIQKEIQRTREAGLRQFRLDIIQAATSAYYQVLNARSQLKVQENNLRITRENLELAEDRVSLGTSTAADIYRWQAEVAQSRITVANTAAAVAASWDTLNRLLHRPPGSRLPLREASFNEPFVMTRNEFDELIRSQADYQVFSGFYIRRAVQQSPELESLDAQIAAQRRELKSTRRAFWLPEFTVGAQLTENLNQSGAGVTTGEGLSDWNVGVQATLPLFAGGQRRAESSRAAFDLKRLVALRIATEERVEETIRIQLHEAQAKYVTIELAKEAADASRKNFDLISDAYARGTVNVIELLDAQEASLNAAASASDSLYDFLITIMALQRAVGGYDYLLPPAEREQLRNQFTSTLSEAQQ
ncbi:MAG: TolC family protein [Pseudomonadota bacterium]